MNWRLRLRRWQLARACARRGRSWDQALAVSPYTYAHWQGEAGYRIFRRADQQAAPVASASNPLEAEVWIAARLLQEG